jgi:hypothetical protein
LAIAAAAFAAMAAVLAALWLRPAPEGRALRFEINPPRGTEFAFGGSLSAAVSPDGRMIAFVTVSDGATKLWTRPVDSIEAAGCLALMAQSVLSGLPTAGLSVSSPKAN